MSYSVVCRVPSRISVRSLRQRRPDDSRMSATGLTKESIALHCSFLLMASRRTESSIFCLLARLRCDRSRSCNSRPCMQSTLRPPSTSSSQSSPLPRPSLLFSRYCLPPSYTPRYSPLPSIVHTARNAPPRKSPVQPFSRTISLPISQLPL